MLAPVIALIVWTLIIWAWMYATRIPAMQKAKINPQSAIHPGSLSGLPENVRAVADNYNHLHEQPTVFYALAFYTHLVAPIDFISVALRWAYVALRVVHSIAQIVLRNVMVRFGVFMMSSVILIFMAIRGVFLLP